MLFAIRAWRVNAGTRGVIFMIPLANKKKLYKGFNYNSQNPSLLVFVTITKSKTNTCSPLFSLFEVCVSYVRVTLRLD